MGKALVDVLIPVFNGAKTIRSAIESIQRQTLKEFRIIVIDDGSTDSTPEILEGIAKSDSRLRVLTKSNSGIVDALNIGLEQCRAEYVARHDADDLANPTRFEEQIAYLRAHPACIAVSGAARHIDERGRPTGTMARFPQPSSADPTRVPSREPYLMHPFLMVRRSSIQAVHGYRHVYHAEDTDLYWRLQEAGELHNLESVLGDFRLHSGSVTSSAAINGRISALSSQLAGISAMRRRAGRPDLEFRKNMIQQYHQAKSLSGIFHLGSYGLDKDETDHLEISAAAKMLENAAYKPYELDLDDCTFIREAIGKHAHRLTPSNRSLLSRNLSGSAARLAHGRKLAQAAALLPPKLYPAAAGRLAFRASLPRPVRRFVKEVTRGAGYQK
ncbi:MAG: glycosyltransferase family 2 protein [Acetobacteraceae bacterium]|nr:glycosyltransferase family 2 protein [Acetobacteraceae bacterium]